MTKFISSLFLLTFLSACSSTYSPKTDYSKAYDFSSVKSFYIVDDSSTNNPMFSDIDRERFHEAIEKELDHRGLNLTEQKLADVLVSYFVVTKDKTKIYANGYNPTFATRNLYGYSHINTKNYTQGTLVIDLIDNKTKKTVWRSSLTKPVKSYRSSEEKEKAISTLISSMFTNSLVQ